MAQENRRITDIKIFDNTTQLNADICYDKPCPGLMLATPNGCVCVCGNDYDLNASGMMCLKQTTKKNSCPTGKIVIYSQITFLLLHCFKLTFHFEY